VLKFIYGVYIEVSAVMKFPLNSLEFIVPYDTRLFVDIVELALIELVLIEEPTILEKFNSDAVIVLALIVLPVSVE
jgi:hypothetical protein